MTAPRRSRLQWSVQIAPSQHEPCTPTTELCVLCHRVGCEGNYNKPYHHTRRLDAMARASSWVGISVLHRTPGLRGVAKHLPLVCMTTSTPEIPGSAAGGAVDRAHVGSPGSSTPVFEIRSMYSGHVLRHCQEFATSCCRGLCMPQVGTKLASMRALQGRKPDARPSEAAHRREPPCIVFSGLPCRCAHLLFGKLARMHCLRSWTMLRACARPPTPKTRCKVIAPAGMPS